MWMLYIQGAHIFQESGNHFRISDSRRVTWSTFHGENPKILGTAIKNIFATVTWHPVFVYLWCIVTCWFSTLTPSRFHKVYQNPHLSPSSSQSGCWNVPLRIISKSDIDLHYWLPCKWTETLEYFEAVKVYQQLGSVNK